MDWGTTTMRSPALDHIIERPRLIARLEEADARVILFAAPAGYGKTTLARQWAERQTGPVAWYRTTRASGDVAALAVGLDELLATVAPHLPRDPHRIASIASANPKPEPLARALVATYAPLDRTVLLVLDEYEAARTQAADDLIATLVSDLEVSFLVTSRTRPPWFKARLMVYGEALELGISELCMTDQEGLQVLSVDSLPAASDLLQRARGWPAPLGLAAMTKHRNLLHPRGFSETLYDFLANELLNVVPKKVETGLMLLASASIADTRLAELILRTDADEVLQDATHRGLVALHADYGLSLHPLLRELLLTRIATIRPSAKRSMLARLYVLVHQQRWDEALAVAEAIPDPNFVNAGLLAAFDDLLRLGRLDTLQRWIDAGRIADADWGLLDYVQGELAFRTAEFDRALMLATRAVGPLQGDLRARAHILASRAAYFSNRPSIRANHVASAQHLAETPSTRSSALWARFTYALDAEDSDAAAILCEFEMTPNNTVEHALRVAHGSINLGLIDGDLTRRLSDAAPALSLLASGVDPMVQSSFLNIYSNALSACGRYTTALDAALREFAVAEEYGLAFVKAYALINQSRAFIGLRRFSLARRALSELNRQLGVEPDPYLEAQRLVQRASLYVSMGDLDRASAVLRFDADSNASIGARGEYLAFRSMVRAASSDPCDAREVAAVARKTSRATEVRAFTAIGEAICDVAVGNALDAESAVDQAFSTGVLDAVVLGLRASPDLASFIGSLTGHRSRLATILVESNDATIARRAGLVIPRVARRSRDLSPRELEIHELIAQGLTNREISKLLYISESTTKVHVRHILEKLGARSRAEAVREWQDSEGD